MPRKHPPKRREKYWTNAQTQALLDELKPKSKHYMNKYCESRSDKVLDNNNIGIKN